MGLKPIIEPEKNHNIIEKILKDPKNKLGLKKSKIESLDGNFLKKVMKDGKSRKAMKDYQNSEITE